MTDVGAQASAELAAEDVCPLCGARARLEPNDEYRWVCGICGGPRVPGQGPALAELGTIELRTADQARKMAFAWRMTAIGLAATAALIGALGAVLSMANLTVAIILILTALAGFAGAIVSARSSRTAREETKNSILSAWVRVAEGVLRAQGKDVTAKEMAEKLKTTEADVERFLTYLSADDRASVEVKDAEVVYSTRVPLRVETDDAEEQARIEAEAEREATEEEHGNAGRASSADERRG